ncbi:MAG: class I SAM-dependent methyltransferase [Candidatus Eisenbacteria bacterium]
MRHPLPHNALRTIDLRPADAFRAWHLPGACRLSAAELDIAFLRPPRRRPLLVASDSVRESDAVVERLREAGYRAWGFDRPVKEWTGPRESGSETATSWEPSRLAAVWGMAAAGRNAVDLACGCGRDAVHLAMQGAETTAIDVLPEAIEQAERLAERHRVHVRLKVADLESDPRSWDGSWGMIHVSRFLHRPSFPLYGQRLAPGGWLLVETFLKEQARRRGRPRRPAFLLSPGELWGAAGGLQIIEYREGPTEAGDWTAALVARKAAGNRDGEDAVDGENRGDGGDGENRDGDGERRTG